MRCINLLELFIVVNVADDGAVQMKYNELFSNVIKAFYEVYSYLLKYES